jgi:hypothetical protein
MDEENASRKIVDDWKENVITVGSHGQNTQLG